MLGKIAKCQMGGTKEGEDGKVSIEPSTTDQPPASGNFTADDVIGDVTTALNPDTTTNPDLDVLIDVRTPAMYYGGSTVVQFVVQKKGSSLPRPF